MNKKLIWVFFLTAVMSCFTIVQAHAVSVSLDVLDDYIMVGETFDVEVWADGEGIEEALLTFGFDVVTSETYFTYTGYTLGLDFPLDGSDTFNPYNVSSGGLAFTDEVPLATLSFSADFVGSDSLTVDGPYDGFFYGLFYEFSGEDIYASTDITVNPVPEPTTIILIGTGLVGLAGFRRKYRK